jgi:hypothetical protein
MADHHNENDVVMDTGLTISKCYKASDGEVFEDYEEAKTHQIRVNFCESLEDHLEDTVRVAGLKLEDEERALLTDAIMNHLDEWAELFQIYIEERG